MELSIKTSTQVRSEKESVVTNGGEFAIGICIMLVALGLGGCASNGDKQKADGVVSTNNPSNSSNSSNSNKPNGASDTIDTGEKTQAKSKAEIDAGFDSRVGSAITSPLNDLNLTRSKIPEILVNARKAPYTFPADASCVWFFSEIRGLDLILGPDLDAAKLDEKGNIVERELGNATVNALKSFTEGFVPFRSWVRRLTGADSHAREVAAAGMAGIVRRSYLKGIATARACRIEPIAGAPTTTTQPEASAVE